jgi:methylisocitrate lyase
MTWLVEGRSEHPAMALRRLLGEGETIVALGAVDGLQALLARQAGARCCYLSGAAFSATLGLPDVGLFGLAELAERTRVVVRASGLPFIVDADTGFGEALNVVRAVRELEEAGAGAVQLEDQASPKRCGHLEGKELVEADHMVEKVASAASARRHLLVVARTDAAAVGGVDEAIERARRYVEAGADIIFPEALTTEDDLATVSKALDGVPLLANLTEFGRTPLVGARRLEELGYRIVIFPVSALRVAARAMAEFYAELMASGTQEPFLDRMQTRAELYELLRYSDYSDLDASLARGEPLERLPGAGPERKEGGMA